MRNLYVLISLVLITSAAFAQRNLNLYGLDHLTQSQVLNPAFVPDARFSLGLGTSRISINYNGFASTYDVFGADRNATEHVDWIVGNLGPDNNKLALSTSLTPFSLGFKMGKSYFSMGTSTTLESSQNLPHELMKMIWEGNSAYAGRSVDISNLNIAVNAFSAIYAGITVPVNEKLQIGTRISYLIGHANLSTTQSEGSLFTSAEDYSITADVDVKFNSSNLPLDSASRAEFNEMDLVYNKGNTGMAFDLGAVYELNDSWSFSASLLNIGSINWSSNALQYQSSGTYQFEGFDPVNDSIEIKQLVDSLKTIFSPVKTAGEAYTIKLSPEVFAGAKYTFANGNEAGARMYTRFLPEQVFFALSANYKMTLGRWFYLNPSYSMINGDFSNFGLGMGVRLFGLDFHLLADNMDSFFWYDAKGISVQTGFQFTFKEKRKKAVQGVQFF